jgi:hypothetical protein
MLYVDYYWTCRSLVLQNRGEGDTSAGVAESNTMVRKLQVERHLILAIGLNIVFKWLTSLLRVLDVLGSDLGLETGCVNLLKTKHNLIYIMESVRTAL